MYMYAKKGALIAINFCILVGVFRSVKNESVEKVLDFNGVKNYK